MVEHKKQEAIHCALHHQCSHEYRVPNEERAKDRHSDTLYECRAKANIMNPQEHMGTEGTALEARRIVSCNRNEFF
jgi:hypothetical protein